MVMGWILAGVCLFGIIFLSEFIGAIIEAILSLMPWPVHAVILGAACIWVFYWLGHH
jgi:hypothetical protein